MNLPDITLSSKASLDNLFRTCELMFLIEARGDLPLSVMALVGFGYLAGKGELAKKVRHLSLDGENLFSILRASDEVDDWAIQAFGKKGGKVRL